MTGGPVELALRCYPTWWRERYDDEVRALAADLTANGRSQWAVTFDLLRGAVRARTRATGMPPVAELWRTRTRLAIAGATLPWVLLGPLLLTFLGGQALHVAGGGRIFPPALSITGGVRPLVAGGSLPLEPAPPLSPGGTVAWYANVAMVVLWLITFLVLFCGWMGLTGAIRRSPGPRRRSLRLLAWTPGFSILLDLVLVVVADVLTPHAWHTVGRHIVPIGGHLAAAHIVDGILDVVAVVGWLVSIPCVAVAARRADIAPVDLRFGRRVSLVVSVLASLTLVAFATWGVGLVVQTGQLGRGVEFTRISYRYQDFWLPALFVLGAVVALSTFSASVARRSWRVVAAHPAG
jgi:hypothetical protein